MKVEIVFLHFLSIYGHLCAIPNDQNQLMKIHLQLYESHCGEVALCENSTTHQEPSLFVFPIPCCMPCSCLPTCGYQQNCCPDMWGHAGNLKNETDEEQWFGQVSANRATREIQKRDNKTGQNNNESDSGPFMSNRKEMVLESKNDFEIIGETLTRTETKTDFSRINETTCIRPQVFYKVNYFLDSKAYEMITECSMEYRDTTIIDKCYAGFANTDLLDMIPVTSRHNGLTYLNKYCLLCNGINTDNFTLHVYEWQPKIITYSGIYVHRFALNPDSLITELSEYQYGHSNLHFVPKTKNLARQCVLYDVTLCNQTGFWETYDELIERICHHGHSLPIMYRNNRNYETLSYKNIACVSCNTPGTFSDAVMSCRYFETHARLKPYKYSLFVNVKAIDLQGTHDIDNLRMNSEDAFIIEKRNRSCPSAYVELLDRCRRVICPRDYYRRRNRCIPLYDVLRGLDINVKIGIIPSVDVLSELSSKFVDRLRNIVINTLASTVTLHYREISVWYRPKSKTSQTEYYLFDIFFFNSSESNSIRYSVAVREIKFFFDTLKAQNILKLENGVNIGLEIEFNDRTITEVGKYIDISIYNGGTLRPLMQKGENPRPNMKISNVNWCYRIGLDEAKHIAKDVFIIKPLDIALYRDEYDIELYNEKSSVILFACVDLFDEFIGESRKAKDDNPNSVLDGKDDNNEDDATFNTRRVMIITVCILAALFVGIALYRVKSKSDRDNLKLSSSERSNSGNDNIVLGDLDVCDNLERSICQEMRPELEAQRRNDEITIC